MSVLKNFMYSGFKIHKLFTRIYVNSVGMDPYKRKIQRQISRKADSRVKQTEKNFFSRLVLRVDS